jgi:hypothetical protein
LTGSDAAGTEFAVQTAGGGRYLKDFILLTCCSGGSETPSSWASVLVGGAANPPGCLHGSCLRRPAAAEALSADKIAVDVISARFAAPIDDKLIHLLSKGKKVITVEDHYLSCGFGSALLELAAVSGHNCDLIRILGAPRCFPGHDSRSAQLMEAGLSADEIAKTAREMLVGRYVRSAR